MKDVLREVKFFIGEFQDLFLYFSDLEGNFILFIQIGGLLEIVKEQFERFMVSWLKFFKILLRVFKFDVIINICDNFMNIYKYRINKI